MAIDLDRIETDRLMLRGINETDAPEIVTWRSQQEVYRYFKAPHAISMEEHLRWYTEHYRSNSDRFDWMCIEKESGDKVGVFGLARNEETAEVSYLLAPSARHKGYASEAVTALTGYAINIWAVKQVIAEIHKDNTPSIALVKKLGFTLQAQKGNFVIYGIEG